MNVSVLSRTGILDALTRVIRQEWPERSFDPLNDSTEIFYAGIGLDSVDGVTLIFLLEEEFGLEIDMEELSMDVFESIGALCDFISARIGKDAR